MSEQEHLERTVAVAVASHLLFPKPMEKVGDVKRLCEEIASTVLKKLRDEKYAIHYWGGMGKTMTRCAISKRGKPNGR